MKKNDTICRSPPENELLDAVKRNDISKIRSIFNDNPNILSHIYEDIYNCPILYKACSHLAEFVQYPTINTLIELGADLYYHNEKSLHQEALHFATLGGNPSILKCIIAKLTPGKINSVDSKGNTALNLLIHNRDKVKNFEECLTLLLNAKGVDVNSANCVNNTPILCAAYNKYRNAIEIILKHGGVRVDIDTHKFDNKSARDWICENNLYEGILPEPYAINESPTESLVRFIRDRNEVDFLQFPNIADYVDNQVEDGTLLQLACKGNCKDIVACLIVKNADIEKTTEKNRSLPIEIAAEMGYYVIFDMILKKCTKLPTTLLIDLLTKYDCYKTPIINHHECLNSLLKDKHDISVNWKDKYGKTPLHYSVKHWNKDITLTLLRRGALLGNRDKSGCLPVDDIDPNILGEHLDNCITDRDQPDPAQTDPTNPTQPNSQITNILTFDYQVLLSSQTRYDVTLTNNESDVEANCSFIASEVHDAIFESEAVYTIATTPELKRFLLHPLITSFVYMKWHRLKLLFYANFIMYTFFCFSLILYISSRPYNMLLTNHQIVSSSAYALLLIFTLVLLLLREIVQVIFSRKRYFSEWENWLEMLIIGITVFILFENSLSSEDVRQVWSLAILLAAFEFMVLIGQHPRLSTYVVMLRTVSLNFLKFLLWFFILILAFAFSFYLLFNKNSDNVSENQNNTSSETKNGDENKDLFVDPSSAILKTIIMLTGEFDASSMNFKPILHGVIFIVFVFIISIILLNLLNGLAINDIQLIESDAEIVACKESIRRIRYLERMVLGKIYLPLNKFCCMPFQQQLNITFPASFQNRVCLFQNSSNGYKLKVDLHDDYKVKLGDQHYNGMYLEKKTIQRSKAILEAKRSSEVDEKKKLAEANESNEFRQRVIDFITSQERSDTI